MDELGTSFELWLEPDAELAQPDAQPFDVELIRKCKITTTISRARYGRFQGQDACLLAFESKFIPYYEVRFKYVEAELRILRSDSSIIAYQPHQWQGKSCTKPVQRAFRVGTNSGVPVSGRRNFSVDVGYEQHSKRSEVKRARLESELESKTVKWRLSENDATREGVPNPLQGALIIAAGEELSIRVKYYVKLSKSADPLSWRSGYARITKPLRLDRALIGEGMGPEVNGIDAMEKDDFQLSSFVATLWDM